MGEDDIRWQQRFTNYLKALKNLDEAVTYMRNKYAYNNPNINQDEFGLEYHILKEGLIQRFEYTHELAWNTMKDYARYQGNAEIGGSRDATREAFKLGIIQEGKVWMDMIASRNQTSRTYNEQKANEIFLKIMDHYHPLFMGFKEYLDIKMNK